LKIIIFVENIEKGGVDTFCSLLINQWPNPNDEIVLICNKSHPGRELLRKSITRQCEFIYHKTPISWEVSERLFFWLPVIFRRASRPFLRVPLFLFQYRLIHDIFKVSAGDELLVVNGGFPGGESCRIASIVWHKMGRRLSVHNFHNFAVKSRFGFGWYENAIDRALLKSVKSFISVSNICSKSLRIRNTFRSIDNNKFIYNGIVDNNQDNAELDIRAHLKIGNNPICLILGTYEARKGHKFIFKAFRRVLDIIPNAHLVSCGAGTQNEFNTIKNLVEKDNLGGNVHILGFTPDGASLIKQADILLIGSQEFESFGFTAVEAMIRGKPIVSTNIGGLPEVIGVDGGCGYVVDPNDVVGFSDRILSLLQDKKLRELMGSSGRSRALKLFDANRMAQEYFNAIVE
jgi:L-malate glycosyltransferase